MKDQNKTATVIRWTARILGSLFLAFVLFFLIAYTFGSDESGEGFRSTGEFITFLFFPISTVIGLGLAWKWEGLGGFITVSGMVGLFSMRPDLLASPYMLVPAIPGILYGIYWQMTRTRHTTPATPSSHK